MHLTDPQQNGLLYFRAVETKTNRTSRFQYRFRSPDPRVLQALVDRGLIHVAGYHYGPLYSLTEAGRRLAILLDN